MSKYTTQLRWIVETYTQETPTLSITKKVENALPKIFDFEFPIWAENYRATLEKKIIMHYFNKEICTETLGLWKFYLEERLNLIMPLYNEMYKTTSLNYVWTEDIDTTEGYDGNKHVVGNLKDISSGTNKTLGTDTGTSHVDETTTGDNDKTLKSLKSDLPQANYNNLDYGTELTEDTATDNRTDTHIADSTSTAETDSTNTLNSNTTTDTTSTADDIYTRTMKGLSGSRSKTQLNVEYRQSLINIDKMIIEELHDLFMLIY